MLFLTLFERSFITKELNTWLELLVSNSFYFATLIFQTKNSARSKSTQYQEEKRD